MFLQMFMIAISLSIDALGIGTAYALKKIEISWKAECIISIISMFIMYATLKIGSYLTVFFSADILQILGVFFLILIGIGFIYNSIFGKEQIVYDFDSSKRIEFWEAIVLGGILSVDTISVGMAIAALELYAMAIPLLTGIMQGIFLSLGKYLVKNGIKIKNEKYCGIISGILMIGIGILNGLA